MCRAWPSAAAAEHMVTEVRVTSSHEGGRNRVVGIDGPLGLAPCWVEVKGHGACHPGWISACLPGVHGD